VLRSTKPLRLIQVALVLILCLTISACGKSKVTQANYDKIQNGMTLQEVEALLGSGTKQEGDGSGVAAQFGVALTPTGGSRTAETYVWEKGKATITVYFQSGKVGSKTGSGL
jgi:hypothetical protein